MNIDAKPLAERMRPKTLKEFFGQHHIVGESGIIKNLIESDRLVSLILWGPPGVGKTTLALIVANTTKSYFYHLSAVTAGISDIKRVAKEACDRLLDSKQKTVLFVDEIHRFNKNQQDALLPYVEEGSIVLIGATTENPSFEVIAPLLSRSRVITLSALSEKDMKDILIRALNDKDQGLGKISIKIEDEGMEFLILQANGDARNALNTLELAVCISPKKEKEIIVSLETIKKAFQKEHINYDKNGEEHYNTVSAFIKSMRASNTDAALYYLARMIEGGEDPLFIARRMVIFASEDIGVAQPTALVVANAVFRACEVIGYPECAINLAHGTVYLANAKKDRSAVDAYAKARQDVLNFPNEPVPLHLRNAPTKLMKELGYAKGYSWQEGNVGPDIDLSFLPEKLKGRKYYKENNK